MKKSRKHILVQSLIAMILCVSMLAGATFAWFTDVEVNGNNIIATGTLNVELYHTSAVVADEAVTETTQLFLDDEGKSILWEPGVVSWENLRIANVGNLALSYKFAMTTANENFIIDGENQYGLSQALKIGLVPGGISDTSSREAVLAEVTEWKPLASFSDVGWLKPADEASAEDETSFGIVVYWEPGEDDNRWNLNNGKVLNQGDVLSIDLGIELLASQQPYEVDAYDKDYDFDASYFFEGVSQESSNVTTENGQVSEGTTIGKADSNVSAQVSAGTKVNTDELVLTVKKLEESTGNVQVEADQVVNSVDVHVDGLAADNTVPVLVTVKEMMAAGMNVGNYTLYHMENGVAVPMTYVSGTPVNHNEYTYDPGTGNVTMALASFSEIMVVSDSVNMWLGIIDTSFNGGTGTEKDPFIIANADQLALLSKLVSKDEKTLDAYHKAHGTQPEEFFNKAYYKLHADIDFGGEDNVYDVDKTKGELDDIHCFYPIGSWKELKVDEVTNEPIYGYGGDFKGHFDGNGNTIRNLYQNTWQMSGTYNDGYAAHSNHWKTAMGVFGDVYDGTIENLCIDNFQSDGEFTPTGCVVAYAGGNSRFEDIIILNSNPRVYNTANGGVVGINYNSSAPGAEDHLIFKDITVDSSNKISALWGSYDVSCGGILGRIRENSTHKPVHGNTDVSSGFNTATFENCNVSAILDVYNDCCANYQYYQYRYAGMLIGTCDYIGDVPGVKYHNVVSAENCSVTFGSWNEYWYCELEANTQASYTEDFQFSRLERVEKIENGMVYPLTGDAYAIPTEGRQNYIVVDTKNDGDGECFHFVNGQRHTHTANENRQRYYLPFGQLFTGYGWGSSPLVVGQDLIQKGGATPLLSGVQIRYSGEEKAKDKFKPATNLAPEYNAGQTTFDIGQLFTATGAGTINSEQVEVFVSPVGMSTAKATWTRDENDWTKGKLSIDSGEGVLKVTITDYDNCKYAVLYVNVISSDHTAHCVGHMSGACDSCEIAKKEYGWQPWNGQSNIYQSGNYYLTGDVEGNQQRTLGALRVNANNASNFDIEINLCLNGHSIDANSRVFGLGYGVKVNIMNCKTTGGKLTGRGVKSDGATEMANRAQAGVILQQAQSNLVIHNNITLELKPFYDSVAKEYYYPRSAGIIEVASNCLLDLRDTVTLNGGQVIKNMYVKDSNGNLGVGGQGGTIVVSSDTTVNVAAGVTIQGGKAETYGGNIFVSGSNATINLDGKILDGKAMAGGNVYIIGGNSTLNMKKDSLVSGGTTSSGAGGNFYLGGTSTEGSVLDVNGAVIQNGTATGGHGGNIYVGNASKATIVNSTVQGGVAQAKSGATSDDDKDKNGGNITVAGNNNSTLVLGNGAKILGDKVGENGREATADRGGNIFFFCGDVTVEGNAEITGGKALNKGYGGGSNCFHVNGTTKNQAGTETYTRKLTLKGTPTITDLRIANDVKISKDYDTIDVTGLTTGANIGISHSMVKASTTGAAAFATGSDAQKGYFTSTDNVDIYPATDGYLYLTNHATHCTCGTNHTSSAAGCNPITGDWQPLVKSSGTITQSGNYYLAEDLSRNQIHIKAPADAVINICLNGHNMDIDFRAFLVQDNPTVNIMNCGEEATITSNYEGNDHTGLAMLTGKLSIYDRVNLVSARKAQVGQTGGIHVYSGSVLNLYGGSIQGAPTSASGGAVRVENGGTFNMYGGTINGSSAVNGGAVYSNGTFVMTGGTIQNGKATNWGGNVYIDGGSFQMSGGTITGGQAMENEGQGGNVLVNGGTFTFSGGNITGGVTEYGGSVYVESGAVMKMTGGTITASNNHGGYIKDGGAVYVEGTLNISGGTINGGKVFRSGGAICAYGTAARLNISGSAKIIGGTASYLAVGAGSVGNNASGWARGGAVHIFEGAVATMTGGSISGGSVTGGTSTSFGGGNVAVSKGSFTMSGGSITGGSAPYGGNVADYSGDFNVTAGTIEDGKATSFGNNMYIVKGVSDLDTNVIIGGSAKLNSTATAGANVFLASGNLTVGGNAVISSPTTGTGKGYAALLIDKTAYTGGAKVTISYTPNISLLYEENYQEGTTYDAEIINISGLQTGAKISYNAGYVGTITSNSGVTDAQKACFTSALTDYQFALTTNSQYLWWGKNLNELPKT